MSIDGDVDARRALVLYDQAAAADTALLESLQTQGFEASVLSVGRGSGAPDPEGLAVAVVVGGARADGLDEQAGWLRRADRAGTAVMALGAAAQALAVALGGGVQRAPRPRRGWTKVTTVAPELIGTGPWLSWQDDDVLVPPGAEVLAHNHAGPQAFRIGRHLGLQLHPGVAPEVVADWVLSSPTVLDYQGIMEATWRDHRQASGAARQLFRAFAGSVAPLG